MTSLMGNGSVRPVPIIPSTGIEEKKIQVEKGHLEVMIESYHLSQFKSYFNPQGSEPINDVMRSDRAGVIIVLSGLKDGVVVLGP